MPPVGSHVDQSAQELLWRRSSLNIVRTLSASKSRTLVGMTWTGLSPPHYSFALLHNIFNVRLYVYYHHEMLWLTCLLYMLGPLLFYLD